MSAVTAVERARELLEDRRKELQAELEEIEKALAGIAGGVAKRGPGRPRKSDSGNAGERPARSRRRRRRGGTRAEHALRQITEQPGLTAAEIARGLGIKPNYVYRVMAELEKDGRAEKRGKGYYPAEKGTTATEPEAAPQTSPAAVGAPVSTEQPAGASSAPGAEEVEGESEDRGINPSPPPIALDGS